MWLAWLLVLLLSCWVFASRLLPWIISRIVSLFLSQATFSLGGIGRRLQLFQSRLQIKNVDLHVNNLRFTSSIFSSEASNLITIIATGVDLTVLNNSPPEEEDRVDGGKPQNIKTLLLLAQFLGIQLRDVEIRVSRLPSLADCQLVLQLGELRLDSSVIHRTKLSLALHLYQGSLVIRHATQGALLQSTFAFQASIQALVGAGKITAVEDVSLDIDGLSLQLYSALFQCVLPVERAGRGGERGRSIPAGYLAYIPRAAQVKAECCSLVLEHSDRSSALTASLALLYVCVKCSDTQRTGPSSWPDSHLTAQLSGLQVDPNNLANQPVLSLAKFQVLVQKEGGSLHSDTQVHQLSARCGPVLLPWLDPVSWLVRTVEARRGQAVVEDQQTSLLASLSHHHQLDAWNSDFSLEMVGRDQWRISLHQVNLSHYPTSGLTPSSSSFSVRGATLNVGEVKVVGLGQLDTRLCRAQAGHQLDLMVSSTQLVFSPLMVDLIRDLREGIRPVILKTSPGKTSSVGTASVAVVISQTRLEWRLHSGPGLVLDLRELEAAGTPFSHNLTLSSLKMTRNSEGEEDLTLLSVPSLSLIRKDSDVRLSISQRVKLGWKPSVHLLALRCAESVSQVFPLVSSNTRKQEPEAGSGLVLHVNISEKITLQALTGDYDVKLSLTSLTAKYAGDGNVSWLKAPKGKVKLDKKEVLALEDLVLSLLPKSDKLTLERRRMEGGELDQNKCILVAIKNLALTEPYQFNFYQVVQGEIVGVFKWLKGLHKKTVRDSEDEKKALPKDILINIQNFKFELSDDPFEVKLRDNYVLREDEYLESLKRLQIFGQRIEDLRKKNLLFPKEKIEELLTNLKKKDAEIYVQRAKKIIQTTEPRTRLFECNLVGLELAILADPSMQGKENVLDMMYTCDPNSPWPHPSTMQFSTLWCRWIRLEANSITFQLRDFPQYLLDLRKLLLWGKLAGAEVEPGRRSTRSHTVKVGDGFDDVVIERGMTPLKFYHELAIDVESWRMAHGSCWEPALSQFSISLAHMTGTSLDPSPALPWWDKIRLIFHGRLLLAARSTQLLLHASLDPYNTTEEIAFSFTDLEMDWEESVIKLGGTLDVSVRTASKYDDFHLLHIPGVSLTVKLEWSCLANPLDHHHVTPCAPDKIPEYSINQEHDSYRAFRSKHLNISISMETKGARGGRQDRPKMDIFSSTLRWFENLKFIVSGASRPIRRGAVFNNKRPKKPHLSRHFKRVGLSVSLHQFQRGVLLNVARGINLSTEHVLGLVPYKDGLHRRARADWSVSFINSELATSDIWIQTALAASQPPESPPVPGSPSDTPTTNRDTLGSNKGESARNMERSFFFCVEKVVYMRMGQAMREDAGKPTHKLVIHGARGAWTQSNRDMFFALYDSWRRAQIIRKNVSSDAMKLIHSDQKSHQQSDEKPLSPFCSPGSSTAQAGSSSSPFSWSLGNQGTRSGLSLMDRLLVECDGGATPTAYSEDMSGQEEVQHSLEAMVACTMDDILHRNWCIELVNSQVLLKGIETKGYVIISAARANINQNMCRPVWRDKTLLSKTTWSGGLETMQYYATVSEEGEGADFDNILWLTLDNIGESEDHRLPGPAGLVGSGRAVGGVVSQVVGVTDSPGDLGIQLQRIVSRCKAEFFYVSYGDTELESVESGGKTGATAHGQRDGVWGEQETAVNAFSFVHHDLNASTNSLQYAMLLDIANNLLLYTEPSIKERTDRYLRMRYLFMLEFANIDEQRKKIIKLQNEVRQLVCQLRQSERDIYMLQHKQTVRKARLELEQEGIKDKLSNTSEDLDMRLRCYRETQMSASQKNSAIKGEDKQVRLRRRAEIVFSKAVWRLTEIDGQLGIADINISNFLFTRSSMSDDSVENLLEMGYVHVKNLLPNQLYTEVLSPTELRNMPLDRQRTVRVFSKERPRVGGISVRDHFEINIAPLTINITAQFYKRMMNFAFPEKDADHLEDDYEIEKKSKKNKKKLRGASTSFYVAYPEEKDDVEKMKERAEKNKLFIYIKIPEVPIKVSYKGEKEKNQILDVANFHLQVPTLEYHNVTWTWLDLLLAVKSRSRDTLLAQAFKQKFLRKGFKSEETHENSEEEKARMLLGNTPGGGSVRSSKKFFPLKK